MPTNQSQLPAWPLSLLLSVSGFALPLRRSVGTVGPAKGCRSSSANLLLLTPALTTYDSVNGSLSGPKPVEFLAFSRIIVDPMESRKAAQASADLATRGSIVPARNCAVAALLPTRKPDDRSATCELFGSCLLQATACFMTMVQSSSHCYDRIDGSRGRGAHGLHCCRGAGYFFPSIFLSSIVRSTLPASVAMSTTSNLHTFGCGERCVGSRTTADQCVTTLVRAVPCVQLTGPLTNPAGRRSSPVCSVRKVERCVYRGRLSPTLPRTEGDYTREDGRIAREYVCLASIGV